ncbi:MAG: hypothetical protein PWQ12_1993 [Clostridiales bacterium]|nr:hypothetical protein [Clostridiales bacterium]
MGFYQKSTDFDLGELNIENLFVSDFMPAASGTHVKVYLMGLMLSKSEREMDNRALAATLRIPLQDVLEAWVYWEKQGLVERRFTQEEDPSRYDVEFLSLRQLYIQNNYAPKHKARRQESETPSTFRAQRSDFKSLIKSVEKITGPLTYVERRDLGTFWDYYFSDESILLRAFEYSYKVQSRRQFKAVKTLLQKWVDRGYATLDQINAAIDAESARFSIYREVLHLLGVNNTPNQGQKDLIDKWIDVYGFKPEELYPILTDISKKTLSVNFNYLDKHFEKLHNDGILTYEAFSAAAPQPPQKTTRRKQYTIEKEQTYSDEELEALLLNKTTDSRSR